MTDDLRQRVGRVDVPALVEEVRSLRELYEVRRQEIDRLRALLARLSPADPYVVGGKWGNDAVCHWCDASHPKHQPDCPWLAAHKEVEATSRDG